MNHNQGFGDWLPLITVFLFVLIYLSFCTDPSSVDSHMTIQHTKPEERKKPPPPRVIFTDEKDKYPPIYDKWKKKEIRKKRENKKGNKK